MSAFSLAELKRAAGVAALVGTPLALMVRHDGELPVALTHAQFKLAIHDVV